MTYLMYGNVNAFALNGQAELFEHEYAGILRESDVMLSLNEMQFLLPRSAAVKLRGQLDAILATVEAPAPLLWEGSD